MIQNFLAIGSRMHGLIALRVDPLAGVRGVSLVYWARTRSSLFSNSFLMIEDFQILIEEI